MKYLLGFDIGSSSVKATLLEIASGKTVASAFSPSSEMPMQSSQPGFAEQDPDMWWKELVNAVNKLHQQVSFNGEEVAAIGIAYQMHGLVCVDKDLKPLRPSIIWCDSRAVKIGDKAFEELGEKYCLKNFLNSPGNFTASKLKWVKKNEPDIYKNIYKIMLPGDYIAMKLTDEPATTISGLSEGIMWNFKKEKTASDLLKYYGINEELLSPLVPTFGEQGRLSPAAAVELKLKAGIPVSYRAGDQPNNAFSLNVSQPGEVAATAGTSGVVYGIIDKPNYDPKSRVNTFVHVNHSKKDPRYGVLLCVNGTGILNSWLRKNFFGDSSYEQINKEASMAPAGSDELLIYPFGNGAERVLENKDLGAVMKVVQFNRHNRGHIARAAQEGIVFALQYGVEVMKEMGMEIKTVRAGHANMFLSDVFSSVFVNTLGCDLELYNTDGATGAARGAGIGAGVYKNASEAYSSMEKIKNYTPVKEEQEIYSTVYNKWKKQLKKL
ncbi:MAG TPA: FGGY family carbohydrate kinase [Chitinophagaceae bacterium]|jgi:xylulokinase|nr:FGGY family carbohydrate kinase [Chitinophagaceae bacterium]